MATAFPDGISTPTISGGGAAPYSWLKGPKGKILYVAPWRTSGGTGTNTGGSDANTGLTLDSPLKTVAAAYAKCDGNVGEVIYLLGYMNAAADVTDDWSSTFTWSKNAVHLVGLVPPMAVSHRVRINQLSTATGVSPLLSVTGNNCVFANFQIFQGVNDATSLINVQVSGQHNVFDNVHIAGIGHATMVTAGAASLKLEGGTENVFRNCVIGVDTITRDQNVNEIVMDTGASRMLFDHCLIQGFISNAGYCHVKVVDATAIDRWIWFRNCTFMSESSNDATAQSAIFDIPAMSQGYLRLDNTFAFTPTGTTDWDANNRGRTHATMVAPTAAGAGGWATKQ